MSPLRIGILGTGWIASVHAASLRRRADATVVAVAGRTRERAGEFIASHAPGAMPVDGIEALLASGLDACYVCLPPDAHHGQTETAAAKGVHLFLEKPIARTVERGRSIADAIRRAGVLSQVGYQFRQQEIIRRLRTAIADGSAGTPTLFTASYACNSLHAPWWRDQGRSGGQLFEQAIHLYDLACHLLGEPLSVSGAMANLVHRQVPGYTIEDTSVGLIRFRSGALASISASNCAIPNEWRAEAQVVCAGATARMTVPGSAELIRTTGDQPVRESIPVTSDDRARCSDVFIDAILAANRGDRRPALELASADDGLTTLALVQAVVDSAQADGAPRDPRAQLATTSSS